MRGAAQCGRLGKSCSDEQWPLLRFEWPWIISYYLSLSLRTAEPMHARGLQQGQKKCLIKSWAAAHPCKHKLLLWSKDDFRIFKWHRIITCGATCRVITGSLRCKKNQLETQEFQNYFTLATGGVSPDTSDRRSPKSLFSPPIHLGKGP